MGAEYRMNISSPFQEMYWEGEEEKKYTGQHHAEDAYRRSEAGLYFYNASWRAAASPRSVPGVKRRGYEPEQGWFRCPRNNTRRRNMMTVCVPHDEFSVWMSLVY